MQTENKMGTQDIKKLLISMSLPMMISMLVQALYNIVDSIYVSNLSEDALTAVSLAFPIQNLMIAFSTGAGVGINALLSRRLGEKNKEGADLAAKNGVFINIVTSIVFGIAGFFLSDFFFATQTNDPLIAAPGSAYLKICTVFSFALFGQVTYEKLLQATGKTVCSMIAQTVGAVVNIVLDPIFIFGYLGMPKMGVSGAAAATVIGQGCAFIVAIILNIKKNHEISVNFRGFKPHFETIKNIYSVGIPSIIMASISSVMTYCMNLILMSFTSTATAVFGIYFKLQSFIFMPVFGLNNGMVPILAYNFGARYKKRMIETIKYSIIYAVAIMLVGFSVFQLFPETLLNMFEASADLIAIGKVALRTISISFIFAGFCIMSGSVFQALGNGVLSMIVSIVRQLGVLVPSAYLLALSGNLNAVWWSFPIAEISSLILCTLFLKHIYNSLIAQH